MHFVLRTALVLAVVCASSRALARDLYRTIVTVGPDSVVQTTNSLENIEEIFDDESLSVLFPGYVPGVSDVTATVDLRKLPALLSYPAGSPDLRFVVPAAGVDVTFSGADRDQSQELFEDWLKGKDVPGASNAAVTDLLQALVAESPVEPVAGNPNSLQSRMFEADIALGSLGPFLKDFPDPSQRIPSLFKLDAEFGSFSAGPYSGQTYGLELGLGWNLLRRLSLVSDLDMQFSLIEGDAVVGHGTLGVGLQSRILDWWNLALVGRVGLVGSVDVGAVAAMYTVSAVNHMRFDFDEYRVDMRNLVGVANTTSGLEISGIKLEYDLTNVVLKNGLELSRPIPVRGWARGLRGRAFLTGSHYFVDELWLENSAEIGLGIAAANKAGVRTYDPVSFDVSYVVGSSYDAVKLRLSLRF
jgi:hypothetical protein